MPTDLHLYLECPACRRRVRHYVRELSLRNVCPCPRCGSRIVTTMNAVVRALLKIESAAAHHGGG